MDDAAAGSPEADAVLGAGGREEVVHLTVDVLHQQQQSTGGVDTTTKPFAAFQHTRNLTTLVMQLTVLGNLT